MIAPERLFASGQYLLRDWKSVRVSACVVQFYNFYVEFGGLIDLLRSQNRNIAEK